LERRVRHRGLRFTAALNAEMREGLATPRWSSPPLTRRRARTGNLGDVHLAALPSSTRPPSSPYDWGFGRFAGLGHRPRGS